MVFTIPEGLHPDLNPLAWLVGTWRGKGRGEYPTIEPFEFEQEVVFNHDGRPFLNYFRAVGSSMRKVKSFDLVDQKLVSGVQSQIKF